MPHDHALRTDMACRNCGTPAPLNFCAECGQDTAPHPPSLWEFVHEFIGHYVAFEGKLWQTLVLLFARPGRLTSEYLNGRKVRYVLPLRLYLTASFIFFVALKLFGTGFHVTNQTLPGADLPALSLGVGSGVLSDADRARIVKASTCPPGDQRCLAIGRTLNKILSYDHAPADAKDQGSHLLALAPYTVFVLLPVFAALVMLLYRSRHRLYGEHLVFSFHMHAFWFVAMLVSVFLPSPGGFVVLALMPIYGAIAMRTVYGGRWGATVARALLLSVLYTILVVAVTLVLAVYVLAA